MLVQRGMSCVCPSFVNRTFRESNKYAKKHLLHLWNGNTTNESRYAITSCRTFVTQNNNNNKNTLFCEHSHLRNTINVNKDSESSLKTIKSRVHSQSSESELHKVTTPTDIGVVFDIDGVLVRGRKVIDSAKEALDKLEKHNVPYMYLTNGGCETEEHKAQSLEKHLGVAIDPDQVVLSHSPLRILDILHDKNVLVCGQGPVSEIAEMCGFSRVCHVDDIDCHFPELDVNDRKKRDRMPCAPTKPFAPVEAIVLMGEPVNWEKSLQIIIDLILADGGIPNSKYSKINQQIPVVAVNTDYIWMSESVNPRFGHGGFLLCLESLFKKLTGRCLEYTAVLGKPNLFTYRYTEGVLLNLARKLFGRKAKIQTIYAVGDNPNTDIYGANVYNNYLKAVQGSDIATDPLHPNSTLRPDRMKSILVETGVYGSESPGVWESEVNHLHRDTIYRPELSVPTHTCYDVLEAVDTIIKEEGLS